MKIKISSGKIDIECLLEGAMLHSLKKNDIEYLWQGDEEFWAGQAPVCFPMVGVLHGGRATAFGKPCEMKRHGVARISPFEIKEQGGNYVIFSQSSDEKTKKAFPFDYRLEIKYTAEGNTVTTEYTVFNTGTDKLPFTIGGHPAFNCPLGEGECFEDYSVKFDKVLNHQCLRPDIHSGIVDADKRYNVLDNTDTINMKHDLFDDDAMVFDGIESKSATLIGTEGLGVRLDYQDFANLLIWSARGKAPFVALEPWTGISTCTDESDVFESKRGITVLEPGEQASFQFGITLI